MKKHYIDGKKFTLVLNEYHARRIAAKEAGEEEPRIPEFIGECAIKLAENYVNSYKFRGVPQKDRDELISTGCLSVLNAIRTTYDPTRIKSGSAFSFATSAAYFGFLGVIQESKRYFDDRNALLNSFIDGQAAVTSDVVTDTTHYAVSLHDIRELTDAYKYDQEHNHLDYAGMYDKQLREARKAKAEARKAKSQVVESKEVEPLVKEVEGLDIV